MRLYWDYTYILVLIGALIGALATLNVKLTFHKYSKRMSQRGMTASQVADRILRNAEIYDVHISRVGGELSDYYSPKDKVLCLSSSVYGSSSVAAIGVAAHECGHAIQHHRGYVPIAVRNALVPVTKICSYATWPLVLLGLLFGYMGIARIGVALFTMVVLFQLVTLPIEFNASRRAMNILKRDHILEGKELSGAGAVLFAAGLTYVASLLSTTLQLLRLILIVRGGGNSRRRR